MIVKESVRGIARDAADDQFLAAAHAAGAESLVAGDNDLLELENFGQTEILTCREFIRRVRA